MRDRRSDAPAAAQDSWPNLQGNFDGPEQTDNKCAGPLAAPHAVPHAAQRAIRLHSFAF